MRAHDVIDGAWEWWGRRFRVLCCGCGLAHDVTVRVQGRKLLFRWRRNDRATAAARREMRKRGEAAA